MFLWPGVFCDIYNTTPHLVGRGSVKWPVLNPNSSHNKESRAQERFKGLNNWRVDNLKVITDMHPVYG